MRFPFQERQFSLCKSIHFFSGFRAISITQPKGQIPLKLNFASPGKVSVRALFWVPWVPNSLWLCLRDFRHRRTWIRPSADFCRPAADKKGHVDMFFSIVIFVSGIKSDWPLDFLWFTNCVIPWKQNLQQKDKASLSCLACENIRFSSLYVPSGEERGETDVFAGYVVLGTIYRTGKACAIRLLKTDWMLNSVIEFNVEVV